MQPAAPSMVKVLPAPVWPYMNTVPLIPSRELSTRALRLLDSYISWFDWPGLKQASNGKHD